LAFVSDKRLKANLRRVLLVAEPGSALSVKSYVAGGHGYLVGWVADDAERSRLEEVARGVAGLVSLAIYLPAKPTGDEAPSATAEVELKARVMASLRVAMGGDKANIAVEVLGSHAVLIGVLSSTGKIQDAALAARETSGISGVTSFLSVPLSGDEKRIGILH
jgi:osmotically-inducible protein OsmY